MRHILVFKENLRVLLISGLFLLLAARLGLDESSSLDAGAFLFLGALLFVVRPAAVLASTIGTDLTRAERILLAWLCPRGIVAAAVASVFALGLDPHVHPGAEHGEEAVTLFSIGASGTLAVNTAEKPLAPGPGDRVIAVVAAAPAAGRQEPDAVSAPAS